MKKILIFFILVVLLVTTSNVYAYEGKYNMSYIYFGKTSDYVKQVDTTKDSLSTVTPNYFDLDLEGNLKLTDKYRSEFVTEMKKRSIKVVPFLSNHWNRDTGRKALSKKEYLVNQMVESINKYDLDGISIDFEGLSDIDRDNFTTFIKLLREKVPMDKEVSVAVAANPNGWTKGWHGSYDYTELSKYADHLMIMAYDESWDGSEEGPVASLSFVEKSIEYALKKNVPNQKIVLGIPFYGRIWSSDNNFNGKGIANYRVQEVVDKYNGKIIYDINTSSAKATFTINTEEEPTFFNGKQLLKSDYVIWFENEKSIKEKLRLVQKYNLKGTGSWSLSLEEPTTWNYYTLWLNGKFFKDIENHWAQDDILKIYEKEWMVGIADDYFSPDSPLTRAQGTVILVRALGLKDIIEYQDSNFTDVSSEFWAKKEIDIAKQYGIVHGTSANKFEPNQPLTREQISAMLTRIFEYTITEEDRELFSFVDVNPDNWAYNSIISMKKYNVFVGYSDGYFHPKENTTRAQMAVLMNRLNDRLEEKRTIVTE